MRQRFFAQNGRPGAGRNRDGAAGADAVIEVPPGTMITDLDTGERLLDLVAEDQEEVLLLGGRGGKGNTHFKSSTHQTPRFSQPGEEGEERRLRVELRIIADIGFVGLPNAGKSTLLKVLTAADPKIGNYPFTTVIPNLGVMRYHEHDVVLADIPGLIEGAGHGAGLGTRFLKHIARTRGLAVVIGLGDAGLEESFAVLRRELATYSRDLTHKPYLVVLNKSDLVGGDDLLRPEIERFRETVSDAVPVLEVSAVSGGNIAALRTELFRLAASEDRDSGEPVR